MVNISLPNSMSLVPTESQKKRNISNLKTTFNLFTLHSVLRWNTSMIFEFYTYGFRNLTYTSSHECHFILSNFIASIQLSFCDLKLKYN